MGGGSAPKPDPAIGEAATSNAELAKEYLAWMKDRAAITDEWAVRDRGRDISVFRPLQARFIKDAQRWDAPVRQATAAREAAADVLTETALADERASRELASMGVNPRSGRTRSTMRTQSVSSGLAVAGAKNMARRGVRDAALALRGQAINLGSGLAINPLSSMQAGTGAGGQGFSGAIQGNSSAASILNQDYANRLQAWNANQQSAGDMFGALGMGAGLLFGSDEETKTGRRKERGVLEAVRKMPVDRWRYKADAPLGDGGGAEHVGTMAQDWQKATGTGDGKTIPVVDAVGVNLGAVKELDANQRKLERRLGGIERGIKRIEKAAA